MKKTLLTMFAVIASLLGISAQAATMEFGYCGEPNIALSMQQQCCYSLAIEIPAGITTALKGDKITAVSVGFGKGTNKKMSVYVTKKLGETPLATGTTTTLKEAEFNTIQLDTPVTLDGSVLYVGYSYEASKSDSPLGFDNDPNGYSPLGDYASVTATADEAWKGGEVGIIGGVYGNACIRAVIEGESFPADMVMARSINLPGIIRPWTDFDFTVSFRNYGSAPVNSVEVTYRLGGAEVQKRTINLETPLAKGENGVVTLTGSNNQDGEIDLPAYAFISKVNGNDNVFASVIAETAFSPSSKLFERRVVLEEYTGVGCQFCPRGWYGIETFREELKAKGQDDAFIAIGVHNYGSDPMQCSAYNTWVSKFITGAPQGSVNRMESLKQFDPSLEGLQEVFPLVHSLCKEYVEITADFEDEEQNSVVAKTTMRFAESMEKAEYGLAYVVIQNDLGPYNQTNGFAGGRYGEMGGFENKPASVPLMFNDVARDIYNWSGDKTACPSEITEGEEYTHTKSLSLTRCKTLKNASLDNVEVVVLLINRRTNEIANAAKCKIGGTSLNGVKMTESEAYKVRALQGRVVVDGDYNNVVLYTADGGVVGHYAAGQTIAVPAGLYLVSVDGDKAVKVVVK